MKKWKDGMQVEYGDEENEIEDSNILKEKRQVLKILWQVRII